MPGNATHVPVCVVGGGPAGCVAATQLARMGHAVALVHCPRASEKSRWETLSRGALEQLRYLDLYEAVNASWLGDLKRKTLLWSKATPARLETSATLIDRACFDFLLLKLARQNGVHICKTGSPATAHRINDGTWIVESSGSRLVSMTADFVVDATGLGKSLTETQERVCAPLASIAARSRNAVLPPNEMFVEALEAGWLWSATAADRRLFTCFFGNPGQLIRGDVATSLREKASQSKIFGKLFHEIKFQKINVSNASSFKNRCCVSKSHVSVGDANMSRDPLLSHGLQWAITSAISGAAVANTILITPERTDLALRFHRTRQQEAFTSATRARCSFYQDGYQRWNATFWQERALTPFLTSSATQREQKTDSDGDYAAFSKEAQFQIEPVIQGDKIDGVRTLTHPSLDRPIAFVCNVPIVQLLGKFEKPVKIANLKKMIAKEIGTENARHFVDQLLEARVIRLLRAG